MIRFVLPLLLALLLLAGCAGQPQRITLLPEADGAASAVVITPRTGGTVELDQPYAVARFGRSGIERESTTAEEVQKRYGTLLAAQPQRARSFVLYFESSRVALTEESKRELETMLGAAGEFPAAEIDVVGHTDTRGAAAANDALGRSRAESVAELIRQRGFPANRIAVQTRGKREPLVPTPDETDEPRNRRVEVRLR